MSKSTSSFARFAVAMAAWGGAVSLGRVISGFNIIESLTSQGSDS
jgi:hypothetical protein